jgi:DNA-binding LacI/PurR family transcriptional regulator
MTASPNKRRLIVSERTTRRTSALEDMRRRIVEGEFEPGSRLPTRKDLIIHYDTSPVTIQRVFDRLIAEGFVKARGRAGTFVSEAPPHTSHYVVFFPPLNRGRGEPPSLLWDVITQEAAKASKKLNRQVSIYDWSDAAQDAEKNLNFLNDVLESRVAGVIFPTHPHFFIDLPIMHMPGLPRIAFMSAPIGKRVAALRLENGFFEKACDHFLSKGRKRIAFLTLHGMLTQSGIMDRFDAALQKRGMECPQIWRHAFSPEGAVGADNLTRLLFSGHNGERPDGYLIADDNLVEHATAGLAATGLRIPEDVEVVTHANFPLIPKSSVPVTRLGYDITSALKRCIRFIDKQRAGLNPADTIEMDPQFEDELDR